MDPAITLFVGMFTTLLAIINPLEAIPVFLGLMQGKSDADHRRVAARSCIYVVALAFFFLIFGNLLLRLFDVPLSIVRVVGGIILVRLGFSLFNPSPGNTLIPSQAQPGQDGAFVPLAMPVMFGPGAIATVIGLTSTIRASRDWILSFAAASLAIFAAMGVTYLLLAYAQTILRRIGPQGIDAATRIVGFFVSAMGMGLIFHGSMEFLQANGVLHGVQTP
jgi:multiple antibiotic resistance protein